MTELYRFAAFISYSSKDAAFAKRLHRALESYHIPRQLGTFDLTGGGKMNRIYPVFRDREELPSGELGEAIEAALKASNALIIVCSPNAASSPWVNKEIETFLALDRRKRIFAIFTEDAPLLDENGADGKYLSYPPAFRGEGLADGAVGFEPLVGDPRKGREGFRNAWLKIVAGLINETFGKLEDRDIKARAAKRARWTAGVGSAASLAVYATGATMTQFWRSDLLTHSTRIAENRPADATALALSALPVPFSISPWRNDGADNLARSLFEAKLLADVGRMRHFSLSADGTRLALQRADMTLALIDVSGGNEIGNLEQLGKSPLTGRSSFAFSANGSHLALRAGDEELASIDESLHLINAKTGAEIGELQTLGPTAGFALSNDMRLAVLRADWTLALVDVRIDGVIGKLAELEDTVANFALSENGDRLALQRADMTAALIDAGTRSEIGALKNFGRIIDFCLFAGGTRLALLRWDKTLALLDAQTAAEIGALRDLGPIHRFGGCKNANVIVLQREDGTLALIDAGTGVEIGDLKKFGPLLPSGTVAALSETGTRLALRRADDTLSLIDVRSGAEIGDLRTLGRLIPMSGGLSFSADGSRLAVQRADGTLALVNARTGDAFAELQTLGPLHDFKLSADGTRLAVKRLDGTLALVDVTAPAKLTSTGATLRATLCNANGHALRPLPLELGSEEAEAEARNSGSPRDPTLEGRPWNPCDWRGLLAIFPDPNRGDGWFEGLNQWFRLMHVRYFGGKDWACEETLPNASEKQRNDRKYMCNLYVPRTSAAPPSDR